MKFKRKNIIVEGIDHIGKSTFCERFSNDNFALYLHSGKPKKLKEFEYSQEAFQRKFFAEYKNFANSTESPVVFDRYHIGEVVYAPYRNQDGTWVYNAIEHDDKFVSNSVIVLFLIHDLSLRKYDDDAICFDNAETEQSRFIEAVHMSKIRSKMVYVDSLLTHTWRPVDDIYQEIIDEITC